MRPVITPEESARLDAAAEVPEADLLERAGLGVALAATRLGAAYGSKVIVLAGPGNTGGDGWVAARHLKQRGVDVAVRSLGFPRGDSSPRRAAAIAAVDAGAQVEDLAVPEAADLVIDALFGSGFHGELPERVLPWTSHPAPVLAVDLPSGLDGRDGSAGEAAFKAVHTVTFHALKTGHLVGSGPDLCGEVEVVDIGLRGEKPVWMLCEGVDAPVPPRSRDAHKWSAGSVAIVGGSPGIGGAPMLAGRAALEFGAGSVRVLAPEGIAPVIAAMDGGVMTAGFGEGSRYDIGDAAAVVAAAERFDVMVLGPGIGEGSGPFVDAVLAAWPKPLIIDADALAGLAIESLAKRPSSTVLTPHAGEFRALTGREPVPEAASAVAAETGAVVLLKGSPTFVFGREAWVVDSGSSALSTIGTGDVLAGMIAALTARGLDPEVAARSAAFRHGLAGRALGGVASVTATGLLDEIGRWAW
jgi:hydroxyethylthiazole kinase-like uncharacterized protein yjeF